MREMGLNTAEIADAMRISTNTVDYHLQRLAAPPINEVAELVHDQASEMSARLPTTRMRVRDLLREGVPRAEVARRLGVSKGTVTYHARGLDQPIDERCAR